MHGRRSFIHEFSESRGRQHAVVARMRDIDIEDLLRSTRPRGHDHDAVAEKDRLYRGLDRILPHKPDLFVHLQQRWKNLFAVSFEVLLYDLTSTYVEGEAEQNPKAKRGYSRDGRPNCQQVIVGLVITPEGFPLAYEVMDGNTSDQTTLRGFLSKIEGLYGQARRVWLMDRGVPTEAVWKEMREAERQMFYLVAPLTPA